MVFERFSDCSLAIRVSVMSEFASVLSVLFKRVLGRGFLVIWAFVGDDCRQNGEVAELLFDSF